MDTPRSLIAIVLALTIATHAQAALLKGREAYLKGDFATALKELTPPAEQGEPLAQYYLGRMYQFGLGVPKDVARGVELLGRAAEGGNKDAQYYYGIALALGEGTRKDLTEGLKWMYIAVLMGNRQAEEGLRKLRMPREVFAEAQKAAAKWHYAFQEKNKDRK
jgi:hypothetical protein